MTIFKRKYIHVQTSVALDGNPEPDLVHATGCKQPTLRFRGMVRPLEGNIEKKPPTLG
jgi:hypothetical protein